MPCYDGRNRGDSRVEYINGVDPRPYEHKIDDLNDQIKRLEAICCALINEVDNETIERAEKRGKVDIKSFAEEHKREDEKRLRNVLLRLSTHELQIIKKMLRVEE